MSLPAVFFFAHYVTRYVALLSLPKTLTEQATKLEQLAEVNWTGRNISNDIILLQ